MKPNFPKLGVSYIDEATNAKTPLRLAFEISSIDFDINQATVSAGTPFTSELTFQLHLKKAEQPSVADLSALDKFISDLYKGTDSDTLTKVIYNSMKKGLKFRLNPQPAGVGTAAVKVDNLIDSDKITYFVSVTLQSGGNVDVSSAFWLVQVKFLAKMDVPKVNGKTEPNFPVLLHPAVELITDQLRLIDSSAGEALNAELQLGYEVLMMPTAATAPAPASGNLSDTIGKVADEISDSFSNLGTTLANQLSSTINTRLQPAASEISYDLALWMVIKKSTEDLSFENYLSFMDEIFCGDMQTPLTTGDAISKKVKSLSVSRATPFMGVDAYQSIKVATEAFVMVNCMTEELFDEASLKYLNENVPLVGGVPDKMKLDSWWDEYREHINGAGETIPYLAVIQNKLKDTGFKVSAFEAAFKQYTDNSSTLVGATCFGVIQEKLTHPCFLELIWSYWHEESMMVQGLNAVGRRFQNIKGPGAVDPLANLEIDPLRPLSNLMWGYIQDEQHRLTVRRRAYEYDHHYGISLQGAAVQNMRFADSRSKFIEAFHTLLHLTNKFYKQADDMTVQPDGFPILNALKETHLVLSEGAHNQYGDLPSVARAEMLMQQWLLARPEFREFLPTRIMVAYPERWMDRSSALNNLMGWTKTSVLHFRDLGVFGEQLLLSIRFGNWVDVHDRISAPNWAKFWRPQIQAYIHAYRAATGVDLTADVPGTRIDAMQPSVHLQQRLMEQRGKAA